MRFIGLQRFIGCYVWPARQVSTLPIRQGLKRGAQYTELTGIIDRLQGVELHVLCQEL
jgi:hypothetical protein